MMLTRSLFKLAGAVSILAFLGIQAPAQEVTSTETKTTITQTPATVQRGLFLIKDTTSYFWVDAFGVRHYVKNPEVTRTTYFSKEPVVTVTKQELRTLPIGQSITVERGPSAFVKERDATAIAFEKPRVIVEYGSGPTTRRVVVRNYDSFKKITTYDDLDDLDELYED